MPVIPLVELAGSVGAVVPLQKAGIAAKVGVVGVVTVVVKVAVVAHCPAVGVKVYVPLVVLLTVAGLHVPFIPLGELAGNIGAGVALKKKRNGAKGGGVGGK